MNADPCRLQGAARDAYDHEQAVTAESVGGGWYGCALANLLRDGYLVERVSSRGDEPEYWRVTLRWHQTTPGLPRPWDVAYVRHDHGDTRALLGDARRHEPGHERDCARLLHSEGWTEWESKPRPDEEEPTWLVISRRESVGPD